MVIFYPRQLETTQKRIIRAQSSKSRKAMSYNTKGYWCPTYRESTHKDQFIYSFKTYNAFIFSYSWSSCFLTMFLRLYFQFYCIYTFPVVLCIYFILPGLTKLSWEGDITGYEGFFWGGHIFLTWETEFYPTDRFISGLPGISTVFWGLIWTF